MEYMDKISNSTSRGDLWNGIYNVVNKLILIDSDGRDMMDKTSCATQIVKIAEEYGKQQYNKAVFDCVENAEITSVQRYAYGDVHYFVDKNSMLKLLKQ